MASSAIYELSPAENFFNYNSYLYHHQAPTVPIFGYFQTGYFVYPRIWIPLYPQCQTQPSDFGLGYNNPASFSGRAECSWALNSQEEEFGPQNYSWALNAQQQPENNHYMISHQASFSGRPENEHYQLEEEHETVLNEEEIAADWLVDHVVVYDSADVDDEEGLCEETISKNLKLKDGMEPEADSQICVVCQDCLFGEDEKIAVLDCGHDFHARCITSWLMVNNSCPLCKATGICL
ncbi:RING/U-box superfamily protein [Striga asiatica]|uniref:RING-type E3 ubiquitin transferase n=1 Tax=Striga asiatica TaxID=4170 RepID=A0A5A7PH45_STRAF|nr:RING/U-box superfamily protein [Striga asiatica]